MPALATRRSSRRTINEINMVPFIDVMLVLLIIFMVTAPLITPSLINLPNVGKAPRQPDHVITVEVAKDGKLLVRDGRWSGAVSKQTLANTVLERRTAYRQKDTSGKEPAALAVVIAADRRTPYDDVVQTMDALRQAGVDRVGLSVSTKR
ncbi:MAG: ExbD/TolR family protein [Burkholderiaceae bacterium]|jgi:biopolymer transport protein TolR